MKIEIPNSLLVTLSGQTSRGIKAAEVRESDGHLLFTLTDGSKIDLGSVVGPAGTPGTKGDKGEPGAAGYSPAAKVQRTETGAIITITDKNGTSYASVSDGKDGSPGAKGEPGDDYVLTGADKQEIAASVVAGGLEVEVSDETPGGSDLSIGITGAAVGDIIKVKSVDANGKPTEWESYGWETIADIIVESEDVFYYRWDVNNKSEFVVLVSLTPLTDSASTVNGTVGLNTTGTPWKNNFTITENIQSVKASDKGCSYMISGKKVDGKWIPGVFMKSLNTWASWANLTPKGGTWFPTDATTNALSFMEINEITSIAVGSYTKFFGVGSHIQILAR